MMTLDELKAQRAKLDEQIKALEEAARYPWSAGPWKTERWGVVTIHDVISCEIATVHGDDDDDESNANTRLIAAAPELFMMLEVVTTEYKGLLESDYNTAEYAAYINKAERLLARVRGG